MRKYSYHIAYSYTKGSGSGFGNAYLDTKVKLDCIKEINDVRELIQKDNEFDVVIIFNWILLKR